VVECAVSNTPPPPELRIAWNCKRWNCLPEAGGYLDQPYQLMRRMNYFDNVHGAVTRIKSLKGKAIHQLGEQDRLILRALMDKGIIFRA
jgi:hypothetical protein